jgi:hypothetical protein
MVNSKWFVAGGVAANVGWLMPGNPTQPFYNTSRNVLTIHHSLFTIYYLLFTFWYHPTKRFPMKRTCAVLS